MINFIKQWLIKKLSTLREPTQLLLKAKPLLEENSTNFLPVKGYEGYYEISDTGILRSLTRDTKDSLNRVQHREGIIKQISINGANYLKVSLSKNNVKKHRYVHRLVAEAFVHNPDPKIYLYVKFKDGDSTNVHASNLIWTRAAESLCGTKFNSKNGRKYGKRVSKRRLDEMLTNVLNNGYTVTEVSRMMGYSIGHASQLLRQRAKEKGLIRKWRATINRGRSDN